MQTKNSASLFVIIVATFLVGSYVGERQGDVYARTPVINGQVVSDEDFAPFWKVWQILDQKYVNATSTTEDKEKRIWGAIQGLASSQGDPYTVFFPPEEDKLFREDIEGNFSGVGMEIGLRDKVLTVVSPIKGSPADKAGVMAGDRVIEIDGKSADSLSVDQAVKMIRGEKGTSVTITFYRDSIKETIERTLVRDIITAPTIETEQKDGVFIIRLFSFTAQSSRLFRDALREFSKSNTTKLIVDLRGNPGGYLGEAWDIASWFVPAGETIVTEDFGKNGEEQVFRSKGYGLSSIKRGLKTVVLVNQGSASASEIVAGALKVNGNAKLVGETTFGKGSVQELVQITPNTSLKVTIAKWLTPDGHNLSEGGLVPDYEVKMTKEDIEADRDPQLQKAIEVLNSK